jgi:hypothetical protein
MEQKWAERVFGDTNSTLVALSFENHVVVYDCLSGNEIHRIDTFGKTCRVALCQMRDLIVLALWGKGLWAYSLKTGSPLWNVAALGKLARVVVTQTDIFACQETGLKVLDQQGRAQPSPLNNYAFAELLNGRPELVVGRGSSSLLVGADFKPILEFPLGLFIKFANSDSVLIVSRAEGGLSVVDLKDGRLEQKSPPMLGSFNVPALSYCSSRASFYAIYADLNGGRNAGLVELDLAYRSADIIAEFGPTYPFAFCGQGEYLVSADGIVRNTMDGTIHLKLE